MPSGQIGYTRNGTFSRNAEGVLSTSSGYVLQPEIQIPENASQINISADGIVSVGIDGQTEAEEVGQIVMADFVNRRGLQPIGESFLIETVASGAAINANPLEQGFGKLVQGSLEASTSMLCKSLST